jgi:predicted nucleic acid-binding protein
MAQFDTDHILTVITTDALRDHEANRRVIEALEGFRLGNQEVVVDTILEIVLRQMGQSSHGRDLVVALVDRFTDEARARSLAQIQLTAAGFEPQEIEDTIREFPEEFSPEKMLRPRGPSRQELDAGGPI